MTEMLERDVSNFSANQIARLLGENAIIWIDPKKIELFSRRVRTRKPKNVGKLSDRLGITNRDTRGNFFNLIYRNQFVLDDGAFKNLASVQDTYQFKYANDYVDKSDDYTKTDQYSEICTALKEHGSYKYKGYRINDLNDVRRFFADYWERLYRSMLAGGYDPNKAADIGKCYIRSDGQLVKGENARHRLAMAQLTNVREFPLQVFGVSADWYRRKIGDGLDRARLHEGFKEVESQFR